MRNFRCACGNAVTFENSQCLACGRQLGFVPERLLLSALEPEPTGHYRALADGGVYRQCRNYAQEHVCNWMVPAADPHPYCQACRLNRLIPNLSAPRNRVLWARIERAKRRLLYGLYTLRLAVVGRDLDPDAGLAFEFLADPAAETEFADEAAARHVLTGHRDGVITINIAEADPAAREDFSEAFVKMIVNSGKSYEPILATTYLPKFSAGQIVQEALTATGLVLRGRIPLFPKRIKRLKNFQRMVKRIIPIGEPS